MPETVRGHGGLPMVANHEPDPALWQKSWIYCRTLRQGKGSRQQQPEPQNQGRFSLPDGMSRGHNASAGRGAIPQLDFNAGNKPESTQSSLNPDTFGALTHPIESNRSGRYLDGKSHIRSRLFLGSGSYVSRPSRGEFN